MNQMQENEEGEDMQVKYCQVHFDKARCNLINKKFGIKLQRQSGVPEKYIMLYGKLLLEHLQSPLTFFTNSSVKIEVKRQIEIVSEPNITFHKYLKNNNSVGQQGVSFIARDYCNYCCWQRAMLFMWASTRLILNQI